MQKVLVIGLMMVLAILMLAVAALGCGGVNEGPTIDGSGYWGTDGGVPSLEVADTDNDGVLSDEEQAYWQGKTDEHNYNLGKDIEDDPEGTANEMASGTNDIPEPSEMFPPPPRPWGSQPPDVDPTGLDILNKKEEGGGWALPPSPCAGQETNYWEYSFPCGGPGQPPCVDQCGTILGGDSTCPPEYSSPPNANTTAGSPPLSDATVNSQRCSCETSGETDSSNLPNEGSNNSRNQGVCTCGMRWCTRPK